MNETALMQILFQIPRQNYILLTHGKTVSNCGSLPTKRENSVEKKLTTEPQLSGAEFKQQY